MAENPLKSYPAKRRHNIMNQTDINFIKQVAKKRYLIK